MALTLKPPFRRKPLEVERREYRRALLRRSTERPLSVGARTWAFGAVVLTAVGYVTVAELSRVWRRGNGGPPD